MTTMTSKQATSTGRQDRTLSTKAYLVGDKGPLKVGAFRRTAGQLVPEAADWTYKVRSIHLDMGLLQEIDLLSDHDRDLADQQWQAEEAARDQAQQDAPTPDTWTMPDHKLPPRPTHYLCANCQLPHDWAEPPQDNEWFQCQRCHQRQTVEQARMQVLQIVRSHAIGHNHKPPTWRQT